MTGFTLDQSKLNHLAQNYDPRPILASMDGMGGGTGLTPNAGQTAGFANVINPWVGGDLGTTPQPSAPTGPAIDPKLMGQFGGMLQTPPQTPHFIGGAAPQRPQQVQMQQMPLSQVPGYTPPQGVPGLAQILSGRR